MADGGPRSALCRCVSCARGDDCERAVPSRYDPARDPLWRAPVGNEYRRRQEVAAALLSWADAQEKRSTNASERRVAFLAAYRDEERRGETKEDCLFAAVERLR